MKCHNQPSPYLKVGGSFWDFFREMFDPILYDSSVIGCCCRRLELK